MTPKPSDTNGLSAFNSLKKALPGKDQIIDTSKLSKVCVTSDNPATGHVSIAPKVEGQMQGWMSSRGSPNVHPLTQELMDAIIGTIKK